MTEDREPVIGRRKIGICPLSSSIGRTLGLPVVAGRVRDAAALDIYETPDGDGLRQRPHPVEVSERSRPCPAMW